MVSGHESRKSVGSPEILEPVPLDECMQRLAPLCSLIMPATLGETYADNLTKTANSIDISLSWLNTSMSLGFIDRQIKRKRDYFVEERVESNGRPITSPEARLIERLSEVVAALVPDDWREACQGLGLNHQTFASPMYLSQRLLDYSPLRLGMSIFKRQARLTQSMEAKLDSLYQPFNSKNERVDTFMNSLSLMGDLLVIQEVLETLSYYKLAAPRVEHPVVQRMGRALYSTHIDNAGLVKVHTRDVKKYIDLSTDVIEYMQKGLPRLIAPRHSEVIGWMIEQVGDMFAQYQATMSIMSRIYLSHHPEYLANQSSPPPDAEQVASQQALAIVKQAAEHQRQARANEQLEKQQAAAALYKELAAQVSSFNQANEAHKAPWELTAKKLKQQGLSEMFRALVQATTDFQGNLIRDGIQKTKAHDYIAQIECLRKLTQQHATPEAFAQYLKERSAAEEDLAQQLASTLAAARQLDLERQNNLASLASPTFKTREIIEALRPEWPSLRKVVSEYWPNGKAVVSTLDRVVFAPRD